ncbi:siderophore-interacting protein [Pseudoroseomonas globiformis]|uniref:Siderophore-interacting protein n=1 Tax=Teichococcus globiformis TaxID=2307229 RepID=A0ABV7G5Y8_9PROT
MSFNEILPPADPRAPRRLRHEIRLRRLTVRAVRKLTPHMLRITLEGPDLAGFQSPGFGDHVKLFFLEPGQDPAILPQQGPEGLVFPGDERPAMRDYTPRAHDAAAGTLDIDFALHEAGPATAWAAKARPGDRLLIGGPRGSLIVPVAFDWHLLVGDDTALPAIARRLEELPESTNALVVAEVNGQEDEYPLASRARTTIRWVHRGGSPAGDPARLLRALAEAEFPTGDYFSFIACEAAVAKAVKALITEEKGADPRWIKAAGYWTLGQAG